MDFRFLDLLLGPAADTAEERTFEPDILILDELRLRERGSRHLTMLVAAGSYANPRLRNAIKRFKYDRVESLGLPLSMPMRDALPLIPATLGTRALCPVPLHWTRRFARGFNQAHVLAQHLEDASGIAVRPLLARTRPTFKQSKRAHDERRRAIEGAFRVREVPVPPHVILIDDVATTTSTLDECARVLRHGGALRVDAVTVALG